MMSEEIKKNNITKAISAIDKFWNTNISFYVLISIVILISILQTLLFVFGITPISGIDKGSNLEWVAWVYLIISIPGAIAAFVAEIYTIRVDQKFFIPAVLNEVIAIITLLLGGMIWTAIIMFISILINFYRNDLIKKHGKDYKINEKKVLAITFALIIPLMILGLVLINTSAGNKIWWNPETSMALRYIDVICSTITVFGIVLLLTKNKHAFSVFMISDVTFLIAFILISQWLTVTQVAIYASVNIVGFLGWHYKEKHPEFWDKNNVKT